MTVRFQAFHSIKAIGNREVLFNWSRTNPLGALDQVWRPKHRDELQALLREHPARKLRLIGSGLSFEPIHSVYAEGHQALLVDLHHLRGPLSKTEHTVTYQAGTPLDTVYGDLIAMERMLPASPGVIGIQTLGGALSTGTHRSAFRGLRDGHGDARHPVGCDPAHRAKSHHALHQVQYRLPLLAGPQ